MNHPHFQTSPKMTVSQRDRAYQYIRSQLVSGQLPPGSRLSHRALAKEIGMSFIPVREAVSQLVSEGLVAHEPKLGTFVTEISRQELAELYDLREALEKHAVLKAVEQITDAELSQMQKFNDELGAVLTDVNSDGRMNWKPQDNDRWMVNDAGFHMTLLRAAGNRRAIKTVSDLRVMTHVFGHRSEDRSKVDLERIHKEHQLLIDALRKRDAAAATQVLVQHLRTGCEVALKNYDQWRLRETEPFSAGVTYPDSLREQIHEIEQDEEQRPSKKTRSR
jgi:DNA-binding GntR family transcriptional regulator